MYKTPTIEIMFLLEDDVLLSSNGSGSDWEDWEDDNVDIGGWV